MAPKSLIDFISESQHIINAHRRHFYTLSVIFLLPFSSFSILYPTLSNHFLTNTSHTHQQTTNPSLVLSLLYSLFALVFSNCGVISITYSVFHFFYGQPVTLLSAIKSISTSFLPLLATTIVSQVIFFFISLIYGLLLVLLILGAELVHVTIPCSSPYFIGFFVALPLLLVLIYLQVNWTLVSVVVVVESGWGLEPLRRSARLIRGMKGVALSSLFFYGFFTGISVSNYLFLTTRSNGINDSWVYVVFISVYFVSLSCFLAMVLMPSIIAVNTVLYIYCKANHGELAEEFEKDRVALLLDDGKVSNAV
ncbi:hypothetical protein E2542_SST15987 [Spatholobus suberectus]|nr:hypothetical protein E2542_SST15987 [Spatholobus suberectus]